MTLSRYTNPVTPGTFQVLSTDPNGNLVQVVLPANTTTFCTRTGAVSSCYGPNAEATGAGDTAIGGNSRADAVLGATALGAATNASGNGATALGVVSTATGEGAIALGFGTNSTASGGIAIGALSSANGTNAYAYGVGAVANGVNVTAIGSGAQALGFSTNSLAVGAGAFANGTDVSAFGAGANATGIGSTALGAGAVTTRNNQMVLGTSATQVTLPSLAGSGTSLVAANGDGTLQRSSVSLNQIDQAVNTTIPKLESAAVGLGQAVQSAGAIAAAMSAIPQVSLRDDEPARCGVGTGGWGSQYAISAGCALRVADRVHLNGAIAYTPSVDYQYGSTPSVAGRVGFSFPLGVVNKASAKTTNTEIASVSAELTSLRQDVTNRDKQISLLKEQLEALVNRQSSTPSAGSAAERQLIGLLRNRIEELENDKKKSELEDQKQNVLIRELQAKLAAQQTMFTQLMQQVKNLAKPLK